MVIAPHHTSRATKDKGATNSPWIQSSRPHKTDEFVGKMHCAIHYATILHMEKFDKMKRLASHFSPCPYLIVFECNLHSTFVDYTTTIQHASTYRYIYIFFENWSLLFNVLVPALHKHVLPHTLKTNKRGFSFVLRSFARPFSAHVDQG